MNKRLLTTLITIMSLCYPALQANASEVSDSKETSVALVQKEYHSPHPTIIWAGPTPCNEEHDDIVFKPFFDAGGYKHFLIVNATITPQKVKDILYTYADNMSPQNQRTGIFKGSVTLDPQSKILFSLQGHNPLYLGFNSLYINGKEVRIGLRGQQAAATLYRTVFLTSDKAQKQPKYKTYFDNSGIEQREVFVGTFLYVAPVYECEHDIVCAGPIIPRVDCDSNEEYDAQFERYLAEGGKVNHDWMIKLTAYEKQTIGNIHLASSDPTDPASSKTGIIKGPITLENGTQIIFSIRDQNPLYKGITAIDVNGRPVIIGFNGLVSPGFLLYPKVFLTSAPISERASLKTDFEGEKPVNTAEVGTLTQ